MFGVLERAQHKECIITNKMLWKQDLSLCVIGIFRASAYFYGMTRGNVFNNFLIFTLYFQGNTKRRTNRMLSEDLVLSTVRRI